MSRINNPAHLVGYWPLNNHADDLSSNGNNGTWTAEAYAENQHGIQAGDFNGTSAFINIPAATSINNLAVLSIVAWIFPEDNGDDNEIFSKASSSRELRLAGTTPNRFLRGCVNTSSAAGCSNSAAGSIQNNNCYHVAMTYDDGGDRKTRLYINGEEVSYDLQDTATGTINDDNTSPINIGQRTVGGRFFSGLIYEGRYYNIVLTADEIKTLFLKTSPKQLVAEQPIAQAPDLSDSSLKGAWLNNRVIGTPDDASTEGNDLTVFGAPTMEKVGAKFDGSADYLRRIEANWQSGDSQGTITAWIKLSSLGSAQVIWSTADEAATTRYLYLQITSGNSLQILKNNAGVARTVTGSTVFIADRWYHVACISNGSAYSLVVDGIAETLSGFNNGDWLNLVGQRDNILIGALQRTAVADHFNGEIRDVRYHNEVKTIDYLVNEYSRGVPDNMLVLHVMGDGIDRSIYPRALDVVGTPTIGRRLVLNGSTDYLREVISDWQSSDSLGTICAWMRRDVSSGATTIFSSADEASATRFFNFRINGTGLEITQRNNDTLTVVSGDTSFIVGKWYHIAVTSNGTSYTLYVNGVAETLSGVNNGDWLADTANRDNINIGVLVFSGISGFWNGKIDDVRVYSDTKTVDFIKDYYLRTRIFY